MDITKAGIANALTSVADNHVVAVANDIYDERAEQYQADINEAVNSDIQAIKTDIQANADSIEEVKNIAHSMNDAINANIKEYLGTLQQMATGFSFKTTEGEVFFNWEDLTEKKK